MKRVVIISLVAVLGSPMPLAGQSAQDRVTGVAVRLQPGSQLSEVRGELLAVMADTVWLGPTTGEGPVPFAFEDIRRARVRAHGAGASWTLERVFLGWGLTTLGLLVACLQVENGGCVAVPLVTAIPWGIVGGLAAHSNEAGSWLGFPSHNLEGLRPYARFPQGLPETMRR